MKCEHYLLFQILIIIVFLLWFRYWQNGVNELKKHYKDLINDMEKYNDILKKDVLESCVDIGGVHIPSIHTKEEFDIKQGKEETNASN